VVEVTAVVNNGAGIHVRPAGVIFSAVKGYEGSITVRSDDGVYDCGRVMGLIAMGLSCGDRVTIEVAGPDEVRKAAEVKELFERRYDFPPRNAG
jgi:phosphocarrier protein HPr